MQEVVGVVGLGAMGTPMAANLERSTGARWAAANWDTVLSWWREYQPGGALDILVKDMRSLLDDAAERRLPLPVAGLAFQRLHDVWH